LALITICNHTHKVATAADLDVTVSSFTFSVGGSAEIAGGITAFRSVDTATTGGIKLLVPQFLLILRVHQPGEIITLTNNALVLS
jgi:hypothetical protein